VRRAITLRATRLLALAATIAATALVWSQGRGNPNEWPTAYGDAQHTSWIRTDVNISPETMSHPPPRVFEPGALRRDVSPKPGEGGQPGFELQWKTTLESPVRHGVSLGAGVVTSGVNIFTPLSTIAAPANQIFAVDNDTGNVFWTRRFEGALTAGTAACPGGISGTLTRMVSLTTPPPGAGRGGGRGRGSYSSAVGEPGAGVPLPGRGGAGRGAPAPATTPPAAAAARAAAAAVGGGRAAAPPPDSTIPPGQWRPSPFPTNAAAQGSWGGLFRPSGVVYAVSGDGMFRTLGLVSGKDVQRPVPFVPVGARFSDLIAVNDRVYTATSGGCGGAADGIWAIDIASDAKPVVSWKSNGGPPIGSVAFATNGTAIVAIGPGAVTAGGYANAIVALDPKTLAVTDWFRQPGVEFAAPPVLFQEAGREIVVVTTKDGRILLLDSGSLGGTNHDTPLFASASLTGGAVTFATQSPAVWQERTLVPATVPAAAAPPADGPRWLLVPILGRLPASVGAAGNGAVSTGAILGVRIAYQDGKFAVHPEWTSQNIAAPLTPIVVNGVAFAASGPSNAPAALYALHGSTGKPLWNSERTITSSLSGRSFWVGSGHVFVGTRDGTVYAFGFAMERK
jgi:outer membrane protein assembly factor BamB